MVKIWNRYKKIFSRNLDIKDLPLILLLCFSFLITTISMFTIFNLLFHSDAAAANILAREQMLTGEIFPSSWHTSTGIFIFFYNLIIIPLSFFTQDQILLRNISVFIVLIATISIVTYFFKRYMKSKAWIIFFLLFFSATSPVIVEMGMAQAAYLPWLFEFFLMLILFFTSFDENYKIKNKGCLIFLFLFFSYLLLLGVHALIYFHLPFLGGICLTFFIEQYKKNFEEIKCILLKFVYILLIFIVAIVVGYILHNILANAVGFVSLDSNPVYPRTTNSFDDFILFILQSIGVQQEVKLFSLKGIMNFIVLGVFLFALLCNALIYTKYNEESYIVKTVINIVTVGVVLFTYFNFMIYSHGIGNERYMFRPILLIYIVASYYVCKYCMSGFLLKVLTVGVVSAFVLPYNLSNAIQITEYSQNKKEQLGIVEFLERNDLTVGYASFWNAYNNMVLSDFSVEIGGINYSNKLEPFYWLTADRYYQVDNPEENTFLLMTEDERNIFDASLGSVMLGAPTRKLQYEEYYIYEYDYHIAQNNFEGRYNEISLLDVLYLSDDNMKIEEGVTIESGQFTYGPYIPLDAGTYEIEFNFSDADEVNVRLTADKGDVVIEEYDLTKLSEVIQLQLTEDVNDFEIVLRTSGKAKIEDIILNKTTISLLNKLHVSDDSMMKNEKITLSAGQVVYGPYIELNKGKYEIEIQFAESSQAVNVQLTKDSGKSVLKESVVSQNTETIQFEIKEKIEAFEVVLNTEGTAIIENIVLTKIIQ